MSLCVLANCQPCNSLCTSASFHFLHCWEIPSVKLAEFWEGFAMTHSSWRKIIWMCFGEYSSVSNKSAAPGLKWIRRRINLLWTTKVHPQMIEIHAELKRLLSQMHDTVYQKQEKILHFLEEEESCFMLWLYSEKLAVYLWSHHLLYLLYSALHHEQQPGGWQLRHAHKFQSQNGFREQS